jgi:glycogen debranching enzyme
VSDLTLSKSAIFNKHSETRITYDSNEAQHILANSNRTGERVRSLKHGDAFAVFDHYGDIRPVPTGEDGLYYDGTRFLSGLTLEIDGARPLLLSSTVRDDNDQLVVSLTNPDLFRQSDLYLTAESLHISKKIFLFDATCYQEFKLENYAFVDAHVLLSITFEADYRDIYEVRGMSRRDRGINLPVEVAEREVILRYQGLDGELRSTQITFAQQPTEIGGKYATFQVALESRETFVISMAVACARTSRDRSTALPIEIARALLLSEIDQQKAGSCGLLSSNGQFNALTDRALSDLHMMVTQLPTGPYPYAGVPWFNTPFGRDGIITAWECLWMRPDLAKGVLAYLASTQATTIDPEQDAEPGKILHETRSGEMAALKEMPFGRYYGSVDATPLFVALAGAYYERTGDITFIREIWPNVCAALRWLTSFGDKDGDGFVEYQRRSADGLIHQGWKDADDAIFHFDGAPAEGAIALCEVQGYAYAAFRAASTLAHVLGENAQAIQWAKRAGALKTHFNDVFWCEEISTYAIALDGKKRRCRVVSSNAGHCLFTGIATPERAVRVAETLLSDSSYSGWGIRTVCSSESRFNPMAYHNGSVWPHDNALIAYGMARYGLMRQASRVFKGLFDAAMYFDLHRMPELFCGFSHEVGEGPVLYPVACAPQAWSAASIFMLLQSSLGLKVDGIGRQVALQRPVLPDFLQEVRIMNLQVGGASLDLDITRVREEVSVTASENESNIRIAVLK